MTEADYLARILDSIDLVVILLVVIIVTLWTKK